MSDLKDTYNRIAADWDRDHKDDAWWKVEIEPYLKHVPTGGSILDLGCGPGHKSAFFVSRGYEVMGVDLSSEMIEIAKRDVAGAHFDVLDMYDLPTIGKKFDSVFACASLLHIPKKDVLHILCSIAAILKQGGTCYVSVKAQRAGENEEVVAKEDDYGYEYERFFSFFTADELRDLFVRAGFTPIHEAVTTAGKTQWLVLVGKLH